MSRILWSLCALTSKALNRGIGGKRGETLCCNMWRRKLQGCKRAAQIALILDGLLGAQHCAAEWSHYRKLEIKARLSCTMHQTSIRLDS